MHNCEICKKEFQPKDLKRPTRTCSKECKNTLARNNTLRQFSDPQAREVQRQKSLAQKLDLQYQKKFSQSMASRTQRWMQQGHPRLGMQQSDRAKKAIGEANRGRFKGKSWEEIYGPDVAARRRAENSLSMSKKNEVLLKEKRSSLEEKLLPYLPGYQNNIQVGKYNVDFIDFENKKIIEVYGNYWHCNPAIYSDNYYHPYFKMTAKERRQLDENRIKYLTSQGYDVKIVWETDLDKFISKI